MAWGFVVLWILPDDPIRARFLTDRERYVVSLTTSGPRDTSTELSRIEQAVERLRGNQAGITSKMVRPGQALATFKDPKVLVLALMMFSLCCEWTSTSFRIQVLKAEC